MMLKGLLDARQGENDRPLGLQFRSSVSFVTLVCFMSVFIDLLIYSIIIPIIPFRLETLGYNEPSALTGWLLVAYSSGLVCATPPLAFLAERYWSRRRPLTISLIILAVSQVLFMEAPNFAIMVVSRCIQGMSSAAVWVIAFSLLCDTVSEDHFGRQLGIVMMGVRAGYLCGPILGGFLNESLGYRAPFILAIGFCALDLLGRFLVIEKHEAERWMQSGQSKQSMETGKSIEDISGRPKPTLPRRQSQMSVLKVLATLARSRRAFVALLNIFINGLIFTMLEPTLPLRLQALYGYTSFKVGIVYLAYASPAIISTPLAGWIADKAGVEWVTLGCLMISIPWWIVMGFRGSIVLLVVCLAIVDILLAAVATPLTADLAAVARRKDGVGNAHVFGAYNMAYSLAGLVGPIIGGQIYTYIEHGWSVIVFTVAGLLFLGGVAASIGAGERPLLLRLSQFGRTEKPPISNSPDVPIKLTLMEHALASSTETDLSKEPKAPVITKTVRC